MPIWPPVRCAPIQLRPAKRLSGAPQLGLWGIHAVEVDAPADSEPVEWLLLTTVPTWTLDEAIERLGWYRHAGISRCFIAPSKAAAASRTAASATPRA